ncbi:hypothetical protein [Pseudomonas phage BHU-1]|nr:hypothetical protein [Pseudomonas phage BHU-1]UGV19978.1 hypothetical protein [Pseudomonas phage Pa BHU-15]UIW13583.1 hypothetical protein [Pseudomonas phage Pa BHU-17]
MDEMTMLGALGCVLVVVGVMAGYVAADMSQYNALTSVTAAVILVISMVFVVVGGSAVALAVYGTVHLYFM